MSPLNRTLSAGRRRVGDRDLRSSRRSAIALAGCIAALAAGVGVGAQADAASRPKVPCSKEQGTTVAATSSVRVYRRGSSDDAVFYGCWLASHRRTELASALELGENSSSARFSPIAGRYVAIDASGTSGEASSETVSLVDLKQGKVLRKADAVVSDDDNGPAVSGIAATTNATLVWAGRAKDCVGLHVVGASGPRTLSCGTVTDLAVTGNRIYWIQDGQPRTAVSLKA